MRKYILQLVIGCLVVSFTGCMSDEEKRAKEIITQKVIKKDNIEKAYKSATGKDFPEDKWEMKGEEYDIEKWIRSNYNFVIANDSDVWIKKMKDEKKKKKELQKIAEKKRWEEYRKSKK